MQLKSLRVRMYKGVIDSGWIDVESLTVFCRRPRLLRLASHRSLREQRGHSHH